MTHDKLPPLPVGRYHAFGRHLHDDETIRERDAMWMARIEVLTHDALRSLVYADLPEEGTWHRLVADVRKVGDQLYVSELHLRQMTRAADQAESALAASEAKEESKS